MDGYVALVAPFKYEELKAEWVGATEDQDDEGRRRLTRTIDGQTWSLIEEPDHERGVAHARKAYADPSVVRPDARTRSDIRFHFGMPRAWKPPQ